MEGSAEGHKGVNVFPAVQVAIVSIEGTGDTVLAGTGADPLASLEEMLLERLHNVVQVVRLLLSVQEGVVQAAHGSGQ